MKGKYHKELFRRRLNSGLKNTTILYGVSIVTLLIILNRLYTNKTITVAIMLLSGFVATFYSKNMIIILLVSVISAIIITPLVSCMTREGMEDNKEAENGEDESNEGMTDTDKKSDVTIIKDVTPIVKDVKSVVVPDNKASGKASLPVSAPSAIPPQTKTNDTKEPYSGQRITPAQYNSYGSNTDDIDINSRHKPKLDYAATLESAYESLDKLLSSDAIKTMSNDTARLAEKQQQLMGNMTKIQPLIEKAGSVLEKIPNLNSMEGLMGGLQEKIAGFMGKGKEGYTEGRIKDKKNVNNDSGVKSKKGDREQRKRREER